MTAVFFLLLILLVAGGVGESVLRLLGVVPESRLDRFVLCTALGLGILSYVVLLLGLLGYLTSGAVTGALMVLLVVSRVSGVPVFRRCGVQGRGAGSSCEGVIGNPTTLSPDAPTTRSPLSLFTGIVLTLIGALTLLNCYVPPGAHEWDSLSYHLANPKVFLQGGRIVFLPTDHHSNFPFMMQMLFMVGLLFQGYALANLFHFVTGALCVAAVVAIGRRHFTPTAGLIGALIVATTPLVIWESSTAYVDMGFALYVLLAAAAALEFRVGRDGRWLALCGVLMGFALSVKTLALIPFVLLALLLLAERHRLKAVGLYLACAVVVGCPFYVKSWILTGNPVYPFAYSVFGGRYWDARLAATYASEQRGFGLNGRPVKVEEDLGNIPRRYEPPGLVDRVRNLLVAPFALVAYPRLFYNYNDVGFASQLGFLFLALPPLLFLAGGVPPSYPPACGGRKGGEARWFAALVLLWFVVWSQSMQYVRYLLPLLPLLALIGGEGACRLMERGRAFRWPVGAAIVLQFGLTLSFFLPQLPEQFRRAFNPAAREEYLIRSVNIYASQQWLNRNTPRDAGVVLFEETRGFYLDRPYLWGNAPHSLYIPYDRFRDGREMADWFLARGYRYALVNLQFSPYSQSQEGRDRLKQAMAEGSIARLMLEWYDPKMSRDERWRQILGDAMWNGGAVYIPEASFNRTVVLEFRPKQQSVFGVQVFRCSGVRDGLLEHRAREGA